MELQHPSFEQVNEARKQFLLLYQQYWLEHSRFSWQWWFLLITVFSFWFVWWRLINKKRIHEILNFGFIVGIISFVLDMIGMNHSAWAYPIRLYWAFIPPLLPYDLTYSPVILMLAYQRYGKSFSKFIIAITFVAAFFSFICEPFFHWIGVYQIYRWNYFYSFPIYVLVACVSKVLVDVLNKKAE